MSYTLTIVEKPGYLHATVTGKNSRENVIGYMEEVAGACRSRKCSRVLVEERLEGPRLPMLDVFSIASEGSMRSYGVFTALAYVDVHASGDLMRFAVTVAENRYMPVRLFPTVEEAARWLEEKVRKAAAEENLQKADGPSR